MAYATIDAMYEDLGLDMQKRRVFYRLAGEIQDSEIVERGVRPGSDYANQMGDDAVLADGLLFDRSTFHGPGEVLISDVEYA